MSDQVESEEKTPRQLWIEALRSGKYHQGNGALRIGNQYCCLGVACEVYQNQVGGLEVVSERHGIKQDGRDNVTYSYDGCDAMLPVDVQKWLGLRSEDGEWDSTAYMGWCGEDGDGMDEMHEDLKHNLQLFTTLTDANDSGAPFSQIADIIEFQPVSMF